MSEIEDKSEQIEDKVKFNLKNLVDSESEDEEREKIEPNDDENDDEEIIKRSRKILSSSESDHEEIKVPKVDRRKNKNPKKKDLKEKKTRVSFKLDFPIPHLKFNFF